MIPPCYTNLEACAQAGIELAGSVFRYVKTEVIQATDLTPEGRRHLFQSDKNRALEVAHSHRDDVTCSIRLIIINTTTGFEIYIDDFLAHFALSLDITHRFMSPCTNIWMSFLLFLSRLNRILATSASATDVIQGHTWVDIEFYFRD